MPIVARRVVVRSRMRVERGSDADGPVTLVHIGGGPGETRTVRAKRLFMMRPPAPFDSFTNRSHVRGATARRVRRTGQPVAAGPAWRRELCRTLACDPRPPRLVPPRGPGCGRAQHRIGADATLNVLIREALKEMAPRK